MKRYWVVGGEYRDTDFVELAPGRVEERIGPFATYEDAHKAWAGRAWATVDSCLVRYVVTVEQTAAKPLGAVA